MDKSELLVQMNSTQKNFSIKNDQLIWNLPHLEFKSGNQISVREFKVVMTSKGSYTISTNLISRDMFNPDGVIAVKWPSNIVIIKTRESNYWPVDSLRPRQIVFTLDGQDLSDLTFAYVVISIK